MPETLVDIVKAHYGIQLPNDLPVLTAPKPLLMPDGPILDGSSTQAETDISSCTTEQDHNTDRDDDDHNKMACQLLDKEKSGPTDQSFNSDHSEQTFAFMRQHSGSSVTAPLEATLCARDSTTVTTGHWIDHYPTALQTINPSHSSIAK